MDQNLMIINLDSIVFGLQSYGGISNYWDKLIRFIDKSKKIQCQISLPKTIKYKEYNLDLYPNSIITREQMPTLISRYMNVRNNEKFDIFHTSYYRRPSKKTQKYVVTVYDFIYERYAKGPALWINSWQKLQSIKMADEVICISESTRKDILRYIPSINQSKVHVIHLGLDNSLYYQKFCAECAESSELKNVVLYVGQREGYKRFDIAVNSLNQCSNLKFYITGPKLSEKEVKLLNYKLPGRWFFLGAVSQIRLRELYSSVFALIYTSEYEGFGLPLLEAMACGCPVLALNTSSLAEIGGDAVLFSLRQDAEEYASNLNKLIKSSILRQKIINAGLLQVKKFTWEDTFNKTIAIYSR